MPDSIVSIESIERAAARALAQSATASSLCPWPSDSEAGRVYVDLVSLQQLIATTGAEGEPHA